MGVVSITPEGPFSLAASRRFLEGFTPASHGHEDAADGVLRLAFPADDHVSVVGCAVRQDEEAGASDGGGGGEVRAEYTVEIGGRSAGPGPWHGTGRGTGGGTRRGTAGEDEVRAQVARVLSLDVDASGFPGLGDKDAVVASLQEDYPGLRPVCFFSPYEAAVWAVIGNRIRTTQAAGIKARLAREHGVGVEVAGQRLSAFPTPAVLRGIARVPGLTEIKIERLHAIAEAADEGRLDAAELRARPAEEALAALREIPGIGPFSAELILIRGAGHPDVLPLAEPRVRRAVAEEYGLDAATVEDPRRLARVAEAWRPYQSWVASLLRVRAQDRAASGTGR